MGATSAPFPKKDQHSTPPGEVYPEAAISASRLTLFKLSSKLLSVIRSLFKQSHQRRLLQTCDSQSRGLLEKTLLLCGGRWRSLTAATCAPASNSASISARDLYCCGDSITISLLGALPARPCMVGSLSPVSCPVRQSWVSPRTSCHGTKLPCSAVIGERSPGCPVILPLHSITITPSLSLSVPLCLSSEGKGPSHSLNCAAVSVDLRVF